MDATEKILQFDTYGALVKEIERDMNDGDPLRCRYPVRFILLNNFNVFTRLAQDIASLGVGTLNLEDLLPDDNQDGWITTDQLLREVKKCTEKTFITPFSELVRFYSESDFRGFFNELMISTEDIDHPHKRIYIPLIGLQNRFCNFLNGFARLEESAPIWAYLEEEHKTEVFLTKIKNETNALATKHQIVCLDTVYAWLRFWKSQAPQTRIICSSGPIYRRNKHSDPDNIFTFMYIDNSHEYITSFLGIDLPFAYIESEERYWDALLQDIIKIGSPAFSFTSFVCRHFNSVALDPKDIFLKWVQTETTNYDRWLMKNHFLSSDTADKHPYLKTCFEEIRDYDDMHELPAKVAERIFYYSESSVQRAYASEREQLIRSSCNVFNEFVPSATQDFIKERLVEIDQNDTLLAIDLCTGTFDFEKVLTLAWYSDRENSGLTLKKAAAKYPDLGKYLSGLLPDHRTGAQWAFDYLNAYREAKLADKYTETVHSHISEVNHDSDTFYEWYHSFEESHNLLARHLESDNFKPDKVYWIDALGAEFLPFILSFFHDSQVYQVLYSEIVRCTIPSATTQNRFENAQKYDQLDALAHDSAGYKKNTTLVKELRTLQNILIDIITANAHGEHTLAIVSDHGLSCLSRLTESLKYDAKVEHDGRYIKVDSDGKLYHDSDYVVHVNENDGKRYKVALTHSSLGRKPVHEVHGGCTPEEVLVPYILITNKKQDLIQYKYELLTKEIKVSEPVVTVNIMPEPKKVILSIGGQDYNMTRSGSKWSTRVNGLEEGEHKVGLQIPGGTPFNTTIKIIGTGFSGNDFLDF